MPHLENEPQHFFKSPKDKSVHRKSKKEMAKKMSSERALRVWKETGKKPKGLHKVSVHSKNAPWNDSIYSKREE